MLMERINKQIEFLIEIDRLKSINRRNYISDGARNENDAEHSWYFAMAALLLAEYSEGSSKLWALVEKIINKAADEGKLDKV